jgi:1-acyl-sn-glycerol-3-phosphate acyltransferase
VELTYRSMEVMAQTFFWATGAQITYAGGENIPESGSAVVAINHTSYVDWLAAGLAALRRGRRLRYLVKGELQQVKIINFAIKHTKTIPVDRTAGADAYATAVQRLREGELVGIYPEATISRSFELQEFKTGVARMAHEADVPIIPVIVWGSQRLLTKGHPKQLRRNGVPIIVSVGTPLVASADIEQTLATLHKSMTTLLRQVQQRYPHPAGQYWVPRRLGGGAPTLAEAAQLDAEEAIVKAATNAQHVGSGRKR